MEHSAQMGNDHLVINGQLFDPFSGTKVNEQSKQQLPVERKETMRPEFVHVLDLRPKKLETKSVVMRLHSQRIDARHSRDTHQGFSHHHAQNIHAPLRTADDQVLELQKSSRPMEPGQEYALSLAEIAAAAPQEMVVAEPIAIEESVSDLESILAATSEETGGNEDASEDVITLPENRSFRLPGSLWAWATAGVSVLLIASYLTYLSWPSVTLRMAASRAGFSPQVPGYLPTDYSFEGPKSYSPGQIVISFSNSGAELTLTERQTLLDSESLLDNHVVPQADKYLTFMEKGLTIYVYGNKATWVSSGIWYTLESNTNISEQELVRVASSI